MARLDAPFRSDKSTPEQSYKDGFETGRNWKDSYRPGGPWVPQCDRWERDEEWAAHCAKKAECNRQWLKGFDDARATATT